MTTGIPGILVMCELVGLTIEYLEQNVRNVKAETQKVIVNQSAVALILADTAARE